MKFPYYTCGNVVKGLGRDGKKQGIHTALFNAETCSNISLEFKQGVYHGWAQVNNGNVYKSVIIIEKNPKIVGKRNMVFILQSNSIKSSGGNV